MFRPVLDEVIRPEGWKLVQEIVSAARLNSELTYIK